MRNADRMKPVDQLYRECANAFAADVARLIDKAIREAVKEEIHRLTKPAPRPQSAELSVSRRRRGTNVEEGAAEPTTRGRRRAGERAEAAAPTPPPLFVHKRAKDGRIESLVRSQAEQAAEAAAAAAAANGGASGNGSDGRTNDTSNGAAGQVTFPFAADAE